MSKAWIKDGKVLVDSNGSVIICDECPCVDGPVIETECCPNPIPETLTVLITDKTGDCTCLPDSIEAVYRTGGIGWEAKITCNGVTRDYRWDCADPALGPEDFIFVPAADIAETSYSPDEYSCNPFRLKFNNIDLSVHCSGTATFTIQE